MQMGYSKHQPLAARAGLFAVKQPENLREMLRRRSIVYVLLVFLAFPYLFFGLGINLAIQPIVKGDGLWDGIPNAYTAGRFSFWNPYINSGTPNLVHPNHQPLYLPTLAACRLLPYIAAFNILLLLHIFVIGFFTFLFLRRLALAMEAALFGGISFQCCGFFAVHLGHHYMVHIAAWLPVTLLLVDFYCGTKKSGYLIAGCFALAGMIYGGHPQIALYCTAVVVVYTAFKTFAEPGAVRWSKRTIEFSITVGVLCGGAVILALPQLLPLIQSLAYVDRGAISYEFFSEYSLSPLSFVLFFFPAFYGAIGSTLYPNDWAGPWNPAEITGYIGILPLALALLAVICYRRRDRRIWFWAGLGATSLFLAMGRYNPVYPVAYHIPIYNMFRVPARMLIVSSFAGAVLSALFIDHAIRRPGPFDTCVCRALRATMAGLMAVAAAVVLTLRILPLVPSGILDSLPLAEGSWLGHTTHQAVEILERQDGLSSAPILVPILTILASAILLAWISSRGSRSRYWYLCCAVTAADLFMFGHFAMNIPGDFASMRPSNETYRFLHQHDPEFSTFRILSVDDYAAAQMWPKINQVFGISVPNNYGPITFRAYREMTGFLTSGYCSLIKDRLRQNTVFSLLGVKYFITAQADLVRYMGILHERLDAGALRNRDLQPVKLYPVGSWMGRMARDSDGIVRLQSPGGSIYSSAEKGFALEKSTEYVIRFEARRIGAADRASLQVDFNSYRGSVAYDSGDQERGITSSDLSEQFRKFEVGFNSGEQAPDQCNLRFYTYSKTPLEIRGVTLNKAPSAELYGPVRYAAAHARQKDTALYHKVADLPGGAVVFENEHYLPKYRLALSAVGVASFQDALAVISKPDFDASLSAPVDTAIAGQYASGIVQQVDSSNPDDVNLRVTTSGTALLVISNMFYPGWGALVDSRDTPVHKAYGVLQAVVITGAGDHNVRLIYRPAPFYIGVAVAGFGAMLAVLILALRPLWKTMPSSNS